ncbi:MAG: glycosyltransferase family 2 protein [Candidatus Fermentibacteraceae bacterium]
MTCTVLIVNYNGAHFLPDCLGSLEGIVPEDCSVMVVDNGSTDGSLALLKTRYPRVRVLAMGENLGFTGGNNAGVKASDSEIVVLLNNDTRVAPDWLFNLLKPFDDPGVGAVTSSMRRFGEMGVMDSAGGGIDALAYSRDRGRGEPAENWNKSDEVLFPCGGAMAVRRAALEEPGRVFWNELFMYGEDFDLGLSLWRRGFRVVYRPDAVVEHHFSGTAGRNSLFKDRIASRNRVLVLRRHLSPRARRSLLPVLVSWQFMLFLFLLIRGDFSRLRAIFEGTLAGLKLKLPDSGTTFDSLTGEEAMLRFIEPTEGTAVRRWFCELSKRGLSRGSGMMKANGTYDHKGASG